MPSNYLLCAAADENKEHVFFAATTPPRYIWTSFFNHHHLSPPSSLENIISWVRSLSQIAKLVKIGTTETVFNKIETVCNTG